MAGQLTKNALVWAVAAGLVVWSGCARPAPTKTYPLRGQVLAVHQDRQEITVKHDDVAGLMPGMTMTFPVARAELLKGREPGELIVATLEVTGAVSRLTSVERIGFSALPTDSNAAMMAGSILNVGDEVPDAAFIDQANRRRAFSEWRGRPVLITFIYTRCPLPEYCPLMDRNFARIQQAIAADAALNGRVKLISVSFDPEYDTPEVLASHAAALQADAGIWTFLTGDRPTIDRFAARLGVGVLRPSDEPDITHNLRTVLVGSDGRIVRIYPGNEWAIATVLADLRQAAGR